MKIVIAALLLAAFPAYAQDRAETVEKLDTLRDYYEEQMRTLGDALLLLSTPDPENPNPPVDPTDPVDPDPPVNPPNPIAFDRCPIIYTAIRRVHRDLTVKNDNGTTLTVKHPDLYQTMPEVQFMRDGFSAPGDLMLLKCDGEKVPLFTCSNKVEPCVAMDGAKNDEGTEALFSVYRGKGYKTPDSVSWRRTPVERDWQFTMIKGYEAQLYKVSLIPPYDITPLPHESGTYDTHPVYIPNGGFMYMSDKADPKTGKAYMPILRRLNMLPWQHHPITRPWLNDRNGDRIVGLADFGGSMTPFVLQNGEVLFTQRMVGQNHAYRTTNGAYNGTATLRNQWWAVSTDQRGGHWQARYGAHESLSALRRPGQLSTGEIVISHYYGTNNGGAGEILGWMPEPIDIEGRREVGSFPDQYLRPRQFRSLTPKSNARDKDPIKENGEFVGKYRDAEGAPNGGMFVSLGRGLCTRVAGTPESYEEKLADESRGCDFGIYYTDTLPIQSIDDLVPIAQDPDWHEIMPRYAGRYEDVHGKSSPDIWTTKGDISECQLRMSSMAKEEHPQGWNDKKPYKRAAMERLELHGARPEDIAAIKFIAVAPNDEAPSEWVNDEVIGKWGYTQPSENLWGYKVLGELGSVPIESDGSAFAELPCDTPYIMFGVDEKGRAVNRDQVPQSLRPWEQRGCNGCHLHTPHIPTPFESTLAGQKPPVVLSELSPVPLWHDVEPWLRQNCSECHSDPWLYDYEKLVGDFNQWSRPKPSIFREGRNATALHRPNTSAWISADLARHSMALWACEGERLDNHTNDQFTLDIDHPEGHPKIEDCSLFARWIDSGAGRDRTKE